MQLVTKTKRNLKVCTILAWLSTVLFCGGIGYIVLIPATQFHPIEFVMLFSIVTISLIVNGLLAVKFDTKLDNLVPRRK